jgi:hypothetical protein
MADALITDALPDPVDLPELRNRVSVLQTEDSLRLITQLSCAYTRNPELPAFSRLVNPINLTLLAKAFTLWTRPDGQRLEEADLLWLLRAVNSLPWYSREQLAGNMDATVISFLVRQAYILNFLNDPDDDLVARSFMLFHELPRSVDVPVKDISAEVRRVVGISAEDLWASTFAIYAHYVTFEQHPHQWLISSSYFHQSPRRDALRAALEILWRRIARDPDELRRVYEDVAKYQSDGSAGGWITEFNLLRDFPMVRVRDDAYAPPYPRFALQRGAVGFYYDLLDDFADQERRRNPDNNPYRNAMSTTFQLLYQAYVGRQLLSVETLRPHVSPEFSYGARGARKDTPDWILARPGQPTAFFECKARRPAIALQSSATAEQIERDLLQTVVYALVQFSKFLEAVDAGSAGLERFAGLGNVLYGVVMYDPVPFHAIPDLRQKIVDITVRELEQKEKKPPGYGAAFWRRVTFVPLSIRDLEAAVGLEAEAGVFPRGAAR